MGPELGCSVRLVPLSKDCAPVAYNPKKVWSPAEGYDSQALLQFPRRLPPALPRELVALFGHPVPPAITPTAIRMKWLNWSQCCRANDIPKR